MVTSINAFPEFVNPLALYLKQELARPVGGAHDAVAVRQRD